MKKPKKRKWTRKRTVKELWTQFSIYIRKRDKGVCISCGKKDDWKNMHAGHFEHCSKAIPLSYDERNVNCQCPKCNTFLHGNLYWYGKALERKYGENICKELKKKKYVYKRLKDKELLELYNFYKNENLQTKN